MRRLALLSLHTSPLAQAGSGDGGGMNVYVRQLAAALARQGVHVDVYTRADDAALPAVVGVEPGLHVHHIAAGPLAPLPKDQLPAVVDEFVEGVAVRLAGAHPAEALHANYWLSAVAGHALKHRFDLPLGCTFHTLGRVKAVSGADDGADHRDRDAAELSVIGCSDVVFASCPEEADQLVGLYGADPDRVQIVSPGVDHAFFAPGTSGAARRAIGLHPRDPVVLYVGRIQPLKGLDVAAEAFAATLASGVGRAASARLVVVGGASGPEGAAYLNAVRRRLDDLGLAGRVRFDPPRPHEILASYYRAADAVLVPSKSESFGLVALEAAACGIPVVATPVGGLQTLVVDGRTGYHRSRQPGPFAEATLRLLGDPDHAAELGRRAAEHARRFTWAAAAGQVRDVFASLADRVLVACS